MLPLQSLHSLQQLFHLASDDADADADDYADADVDVVPHGHLIQLRRKTTPTLCGAVIRRA